MNLTDNEWRQLSGLLDEALDLPEHERVRWVARLEASYAALKPILEKLVESAAAETGDFLKTLPKLLPEGGLDPDTPGLEQQNVVGPYRLLRELGRRGMGTVWLAERADGLLKRPVALKLPHLGGYSAQFAERFARERDILAGLTHPNIARLYDAGFTPSGQPYFALEYVEGEPIATYCDAKRPNVRGRIEMLLQVLRAVQYAHAHLVVHRDLKPSNILVAADGHVVLLDFGIAKLVTDGEAKETELTQLGGCALTPDYASPEQIIGESISTASDVYALGVVLYELLTGVRPYKLKRDSRGALEEAILDVDPQRPSQAVGDEAIAQARSTTKKRLAHALKGDLDTIVLKALKKKSVERYGTAEAFAQDLQRYLAGEAVLAQPDSVWYRTRKLVQRNRIAAAAAAAVLLALGIGLTAALWQANLARIEAARLQVEVRKSQAVQRFLFQTLTSLAARGEGTSINTREEIASLLGRKRRETEEAYGTQPALKAEVFGVIGNLWNYLNDPDKSAATLKEQLATLKAAGSDPRAQARVLLDIANALRLKSDERPREATLRRALDMLEGDNADQGVELRGEIMGNLGDSLFQQGRFKEAETVLGEALALLEPRFRETASYGVVLHSLANLSSAKQDNERTVALLEKSLGSFKADQRTATDADTLVDVLHDLGSGYSLLHKYRDAEKALREAIALQQRAYGGSDLSYSAMQSELANVLDRAGKYGDALAAVAEATRVTKASKADVAKVVLLGNRIDLGYTLLDMGDVEQAGAVARDVLGLITENVESRRPDYLLRGYGVMVRYLEAIGSYREARAYIGKEERLVEQRLGPQMKGRILLQVGRVALEEGDLDAAEKALVDAAGSAPAGEGGNIDSVASVARRSIGVIQLERGKPSEALPILERQLQEFDAQEDQRKTPREEAELRLLNGRALLASGRPDEAKADLERAHLLLRSQHPASPWLAEAQIRLAECLLQLGDAGRARELVDQARAIHAAHKELGEHFRGPLHAIEKKLKNDA